MEVENLLSQESEFDFRDEEENQGRGKMRFSLLRASSLQEPESFKLPALSCRRRSVERVGGVFAKPILTNASRETVTSELEDQEMKNDADPEIQIPTQTRRATISSGTSATYFKKRPSNFRDWPLGEVDVKNDENFFELELNIGPFNSDEVSARIVGKDLVIHCKPNFDRTTARDITRKEIFRCYALPLTTAPVASDVSIAKDENLIRVAIRKESALRSPICLFAPDISEILEEEQRSDTEEDVAVRMDD